MQALLAALSWREGDSARQLYSFGTLITPSSLISDVQGNRRWLGDLTQFPPWGGAWINSANTTKSTAAGGWQFLKGTYALISAMTGQISFELPAQIINAAALAQHDFKARSQGLNLLTVLEANNLDLVSQNLIDTWPGGAAADLPTRYASSLALLQSTSSPPTTTTPTPPPIASPPNLLELIAGNPAHLTLLEGIDQNGDAMALMSAGTITIDDSTICSAAIAGDLQGILIAPLAAGDTFIHYTVGSAILDPPIEVKVDSAISLRGIKVKVL
jgi:hypothetical protein